MMLTQEEVQKHLYGLFDKVTESIPDKDGLMRANLDYFINLYYGTTRWPYMQAEVERFLEKRDLVGLGLYLFKHISKYKEAIGSRGI